MDKSSTKKRKLGDTEIYQNDDEIVICIKKKKKEPKKNTVEIEWRGYFPHYLMTITDEGIPVIHEINKSHKWFPKIIESFKKRTLKEKFQEYEHPPFNEIELYDILSHSATPNYFDDNKRNLLTDDCKKALMEFLEVNYLDLSDFNNFVKIPCENQPSLINHEFKQEILKAGILYLESSML